MLIWIDALKAGMEKYNDFKYCKNELKSITLLDRAWTKVAGFDKGVGGQEGDEGRHQVQQGRLVLVDGLQRSSCVSFRNSNTDPWFAIIFWADL